MKHLKYIPWIFAALPIVAIIWFLFPATHLDQSGEKDQELSVNKPQSSDVRSSELTQESPHSKPQSPEKIEARKRIDEAKKKNDEAAKRTDEAFKKYASLSTPEYRARAADGIMERRDRDYRNLLASWNIDSKAADAVLAIIRERELRSIEERAVLFQNSVTTKTRKEFEFSQEVEGSLAQMQLINILGEARTSEFLAADKLIREAELAEAAARAGIKLPERKK